MSEMDIRIHPEFIERLSQIHWFSRVFELEEIETSIPHFYVNSWKEAKTLFRQARWERATREASNDLASYLGDKHSSLFDGLWNKIVIEAKPILAEIIEPKVKEMTEAHNLGETFLHRVQWDVLFIIMEDVYRDTHPPTLFYSELLKFYERGHFPCGWRGGRWPQGQLAVA